MMGDQMKKLRPKGVVGWMKGYLRLKKETEARETSEIDEGRLDEETEAGNYEETDISNGFDLDQITEFRGKAYHLLTMEDVRDVSFSCHEDLDSFYLCYSIAKGFSMRRNRLDKSRATSRVIFRELTCSREGLRDTDGESSSSFTIESDGNPKRQKVHRISRCECPAKLQGKWDDKRGAFYVSCFFTEHNHPLTRIQHRQFMRANRGVTDHDLAQVISLRKVSVGISKAFEFLVHQTGGWEFVGFTVRDLYNKAQASLGEVILDGDAQCCITWMNMKAIRDPDFYCVFSVDSEGRLANMFWRDGHSLRDYNSFGDVLVFDSTYKTNIYDRPLAVFVGSNNHRATILFGCALLVDETEETYVWVLKAFLASMKDKKPITVITDSSLPMGAEILSELPHARHRLCAWHVGQNVRSHLKDKETQQDFFHLIFAGLTVSEWELAWAYFIAMKNLGDNAWLYWMYQKKKRSGQRLF